MNENMSEELKQCPFCGSRDVALRGSSHYVACNNCDAEGPWNDESEEEAIKAWNTRLGEATA